ncbi:cystathionine beta-lyase [Glaesserella parasuis]|uniref:cysteine-S-conjugate beta-lyase n=1 Tax=Glaesserella parasuis serovar 5 (strain SH0165) TaxID=557723 RepID=B8F338_GLAP5|nr:cystathionine beta-lyase [Glaesserella parasuis]ACL31740.1 cystathionine beta-lyases/cystathionine gamma-synthase [Glaesserella parasuis SH0165]MDG6237323.1 cystathionine beta-lyase [Glaesserella parasuis]MDG6239377.1 cystathionine beta-lyase [Glaesserella parasuis]MDG6285510.1 cystathionine beta-lyase [Glaesserella parasuis]MDG6287719.1 cystathionine beta-lyase [Glaesserella parasuis]
MTKHNLATQLVHAGRKKRYTQGSVNSVIQRASSLVFDSVADKKEATKNRYKGALFYGRRGTLTHFALQDAMCELENGAGCYLYPCGAAAVSNAILSFVQQGDHVLMTGAAYEPTQDFCHIVLKKMGVSTTFYDPLIAEGIATLIQPNTKVLFLESPSSLTMEVPDIPAIVRTARAINPEIVIMIDNTWSAGILFPALEHGIDISIQAGTKYLVGHSDTMIGTAVSNARCWDQLREHSYLMGQMVDADSAYVTARGLRTLGIRLKQHEESSLIVAQWLAQRSEVKAVYHPALPSCPGNTYFKRDFKGSSGLFSFELCKTLSDEELANFLDHFEIFSMAYSWGGFESLILANQPKEIERIRPAIERKLTGTLIRVHIGLEDVEDLITDLEAGLERITS